jgi:hypothetical protein
MEFKRFNKETTGTYNTFIGALSGTNGVYNGSTAILWFNNN